MTTSSEGTSAVRVGCATPEELYEQVHGIRRVYAAAFEAQPWAEDPAGPGADRFVWRLSRDSTRDGFTAALGRRGPTGTTIGFAYGFTVGAEAPSAVTALHRNVEAALGGQTLQDSFALVDLAVKPGLQGEGIGGRLHDALLGGIGQRRCWLLTHRDAEGAVGLYLKRGWTHAGSVPRMRGEGTLALYTLGWP